jgi:hypothetical protein
MNIKVQQVSEMSKTERRQLRAALNWIWRPNLKEWQESHWCVTLEDNALTLSVLVEQVDESLFEALDEVVLA